MDTENHMVVDFDAALDRYQNGYCDACGRTLDSNGECGYCSNQQDIEDRIQQEGE